MDLLIGFAVLSIVLLGGFFFISSKIEKMKSSADTEKIEKTLFQLESLHKLLGENRRETSENMSKNSEKIQARLDQTIDFLMKQLSDVNKSVDGKLTENTKILGDRLDNAAKVISSVRGELGKMQELSPHIKGLSNIFNSPKLRGGMGEKILETVLSERLPKNMWQLQHTFKGGETVDAAIFTQSGIIPIDAKFPLDNFRKLIESDSEEEKVRVKKEFEKDVKKQITDIAKKYIRPDERTTPFAIMYLPAEDLYYEAAIRSESLTDFAAEKNVTMVSPNIFYHFLGIVLLSLQSQKMNEQAGKVLQLIKGVQVESEKFEETLSLLSGHINRSAKAMEKAEGGYKKLTTKIETIAHVGEMLPESSTQTSLLENHDEE